MADLAQYLSAIEKLRAHCQGLAEAEGALDVLWRLAMAEGRRHPKRISAAQRQQERAAVAKRLADYQRLKPGSSPTSAREWIAKRELLPLRRVRHYLTEIQASRASGPTSVTGSSRTTLEARDVE